MKPTIKLPKYMVRSIHNAARHYNLGHQNREKVIEYFRKKNLYNGITEDLIIDCLEIGNNPDELIKYIESCDPQKDIKIKTTDQLYEDL